MDAVISIEIVQLKVYFNLGIDTIRADFLNIKIRHKIDKIVKKL
jgi:hypothetical protein